jgi:hypothetical protein
MDDWRFLSQPALNDQILLCLGESIYELLGVTEHPRLLGPESASTNRGRVDLLHREYEGRCVSLAKVSQKALRQTRWARIDERKSTKVILVIKKEDATRSLLNADGTAGTIRAKN